LFARAVDLLHVHVVAGAISLHAGHFWQGVGVGPFAQLSALARMRALVVLPTPRTPVNRNACATRSMRDRVASVVRRRAPARRGPRRSAAATCARGRRSKAQLKDEEVSAATAGDKVRVVATCEGKLRSITIDPEFLKAEGMEMALDAVIAAANSALDEADKKVESELNKITGGIKIPGM
jgi:DNA-binding protein YbaB